MEIVMNRAFPLKYKYDILMIEEKLGKSLNCKNASCETFYIGDEIIEIPYRIYFEPEILEITTITENQRRILLTFFTRHNDGYIRHKCLKELSKYGDLQDYELAYLVLLMGEYVVEIVVDAFSIFIKADRGLIASLIEQNSIMIKYQHSRMISYWSEYYRRKKVNSYYCTEWRDYVGSSIISFYKKHGY